MKSLSLKHCSRERNVVIGAKASRQTGRQTARRTVQSDSSDSEGWVSDNSDLSYTQQSASQPGG